MEIQVKHTKRHETLLFVSGICRRFRESSLQLPDIYFCDWFANKLHGRRNKTLIIFHVRFCFVFFWEMTSTTYIIILYLNHTLDTIQILNYPHGKGLGVRGMVKFHFVYCTDWFLINWDSQQRTHKLNFWFRSQGNARTNIYLIDIHFDFSDLVSCCCCLCCHHFIIL